MVPCDADQVWRFPQPERDCGFDHTQRHHGGEMGIGDLQESDRAWQCRGPQIDIGAQNLQPSRFEVTGVGRCNSQAAPPVDRRKKCPGASHRAYFCNSKLPTNIASIPEE